MNILVSIYLIFILCDFNYCHCLFINMSVFVYIYKGLEHL